MYPNYQIIFSQRDLATTLYSSNGKKSLEQVIEVADNLYVSIYHGRHLFKTLDGNCMVRILQDSNKCVWHSPKF